MYDKSISVILHINFVFMGSTYALRYHSCRLVQIIVVSQIPLCKSSAICDFHTEP